MSNRRRMLLAIANQFKWLPYSYTYLYHSLIPTTVNSKNVRNKAKVATIYGNSAVVNQLCIIPTITSRTTNGVTLTNNNDGSVTIQTDSGGATADTIFDLEGNLSRPQINQGDYVLITNFSNPSYTTYYLYDAYDGNHTNSMFNTAGGYIKQKSSNNQTLSPRIMVKSGTVISTPQTVLVMYVNLTQEYPFDTPTSLTDNRVQNILNGNYRPHNTGTIENTNIGEISSEPYNLFDGEWELGNWNNNISIHNCKFKNYIEVIGGKTYTIEITTSMAKYIREYDIDFNVIKETPFYTGSSNNIQVDNNTRYIKLMIYNENIDFTNNFLTNTCLHRTGTRTGYAPHDDFVDLANFNPVKIGNIQDTFLALDSGNTFTKRVGVVDLGTLNYTLDDYRVYTTDLSNLIKKQAGLENISCSQFTAVSSLSDMTSTNAKMFVSSAGNISFSNMGYDATTFKQAMSGVLLYYELATYQTISMPLRHLGMVNLGSLTYSTPSSGGRTTSSLVVSGIKPATGSSTLANVYCYKYKTYTADQTYVGTEGISIEIDGKVDVCDKSFIGLTSSQVAQALSGVYLYYETADVVDESDILTYKGTIPFKYQGGGVGTSHDTMTVGKDNVVFTKNMSLVDLGSLIVDSYNSSTKIVSLRLNHYDPNYNSSMNALSTKYIGVSGNDFANSDKCFASSNTQYFRIKDSGFTSTTSAEIKTELSGIQFIYQLATPQTITIPRKKLGVVDLGSLTWNWDSNNRCYTNGLSSTIKAALSTEKANIYCSKYLTDTQYNMNQNITKNTIGTYQNGNLAIYSTSLVGKTANEIKSLLTGIYLFYETNTEVADIFDTVDIQPGGTLTSNMFSWVENQSFKSYISPNPLTNNNLTFTRNSSTQSITIDGTASALTQQGFGGSNPLTANHYYLVYCDKQPNGVALLDMNGTMGSNSMSGYIAKPTSNISFSPRFDIQSGTVLNNVELNVMLIDLTLGFGSGNEPTSINDPRVQEIISLGYIPTNTSGTYKSVDTKVLPNATFNMKCK